MSPDEAKTCRNCNAPILRGQFRSVTHFRVARFCSRRCASRSVPKRPLTTRFWEKVDNSGGDSACWIWTAYRDRKGYGRIQRNGSGSPTQAHIISWEIACGPVPSGQCVLHRCDNPSCVNPAHLFLGTKADNNADMRAKGRHAHGERQGSAVLSEQDVRNIIALRKEGGLLTDLAVRFGVSESHISEISRGKAWAHLAAPGGKS